MTCVLCATRGRDRTVDDGHVCEPCRNGLRRDVESITDLVTIAATAPDVLASRIGGDPR